MNFSKIHSKQLFYDLSKYKQNLKDKLLANLILSFANVSLIILDFACQGH